MRAPFHRNPDYDDGCLDWSASPDLFAPSLMVDVVVAIVKDDEMVQERPFPFGFCRPEETA